MNRKQTGQKGELVAARFLEQQGISLLRRNYRCRYGEIDLIGQNRDFLIFVEVKARKDESCGYPAESLTAAKKRKICQTVRYYCMKERISQDVPIRFDVIEIIGNRIRHIPNAFEFCC